MKNIILIIVITFTLSACAVSDKLIEKAGELNDGALDGSIAQICKNSSVGAIIREFGTIENYIKVRAVICPKVDYSDLDTGADN